MPISSLPPQLMASNPYAFLQLGILALLATPLLSILVAGAGFAHAGEKKECRHSSRHTIGDSHQPAS